MKTFFNPRPATRGRPQYIVHIPLHIPHLPNPPYHSPPYRIKPLQLYHVISASALGFYARFRFASVNPHSYYDTRYARIPVSYTHLDVYKRQESGNVLLTIECWQDVHPGLVSIPVNWDYSIPYGLLYSPDAPDDVMRFVKEVEDITAP